MEEWLQETLLYDFYGDLLTEKQKRFYEMRYLQDLSLSEIGLVESVSPQAVQDLLARTKKILARYEDVLGLVQRHTAQKEQLKAVAACLEEAADRLKVLAADLEL